MVEQDNEQYHAYPIPSSRKGICAAEHTSFTALFLWLPCWASIYGVLQPP